MKNLFKTVSMTLACMALGLGLGVGVQRWLNQRSAVDYGDYSHTLDVYNSQVVVFTDPRCPFCARLKQWLGEQRVNFAEVVVSASTENREHFASLGYAQYPVLVVRDRAIIGFEPDAIAEALAVAGIQLASAGR